MQDFQGLRKMCSGIQCSAINYWLTLVECVCVHPFSRSSKDVLTGSMTLEEQSTPLGPHLLTQKILHHGAFWYEVIRVYSSVSLSSSTASYLVGERFVFAKVVVVRFVSIGKESRFVYNLLSSSSWWQSAGIRNTTCNLCV